MFRGKLFEPTLTGNSYRLFIEGLKSPVTKAAYTYALQKYMAYLKISNPDDLLEHQDNPKYIQNQIIHYMIHLKNPPVSLRYATRSQYLAAILTFYDLNEVVLNKKKMYRFLGEEERPIENREYTKEEIGKMLEVSDERVKAIILLLASTGVSIRAIIELKLEDLIGIPEYELHQVRVYADAKERYFAFTTPEASKALSTYFDYRKRYGEKIGAKSPVFRNQFDRNDPSSVHDAKPLELRAAERLLSRAIEKAGIRTVERVTELNNEKGRIRKIVRLTAGFRKFAVTQMGQAGIDLEVRKMLTGHSIGVEEAYAKYSQEYKLNQYLRCIDNLTISQENRLKKKVKELTEKQSGIELMKQRHEQEMKLMHEKMNQIMSMIQQNPVLAHVKPDVLVKRKVKKNSWTIVNTISG